jgi:hypothetical protein
MMCTGDPGCEGKPEVFIAGTQTKTDAAHGELTDEPTRDSIKQQLQAFELLVRR